MAEKINYVAVLPDGTEVPYESEVDRHFGAERAEEICRKIVSRSSLRSSRRNPERVSVELFRLDIVGVAIARRSRGVFHILPPPADMTAAEYEEEMANAVSGLPIEFQSLVRSQAYERGHSAGYEEVVSLAEGLASELQPAILAYQRRLMESLVATRSQP